MINYFLILRGFQIYTDEIIKFFILLGAVGVVFGIIIMLINEND
jgi:hypothetical protein